jgi:hypothetical protein
MALEHERVTLPAHQPDCPGEHLETFQVTGPIGICTTTRCLGCGAQKTEQPDEEPLTPGTAEWVDAWFNDKDRIGRHLTPAEVPDPEANPLHPYALWPTI